MLPLLWLLLVAAADRERKARVQERPRQASRRETSNKGARERRRNGGGEREVAGEWWRERQHGRLAGDRG